MANTETKQLDSIISSRRAMLALGGAALATLALAPKKAEAAGFSDNDILNFALNLEYLEAQFYTLAASGTTIDQLSTPIGIGSGTSASTGAGTVITKAGGPTACKVPFTNTVIQAYAQEIALEEQKHVSYLRNALGSLAVAQPQLDLYNSFSALGGLIGFPGFDPFSSDVYFLIGSYIFEDVGVTAYHGGAPLISDKVNVLPAAVGIHAVEAEHSGLVRMTMYSIDNGLITVPGYNPGALGTTLTAITQSISSLRTKLAMTAYADDYGLGTTAVPLNTSSASNVAGTSSYTASQIFDIPLIAQPAVAASTGVSAFAGNNNNAGLGYSRTPPQVISIVTADGPTSAAGITTGGFFPAGLNGYFQAGVKPAA